MCEEVLTCKLKEYLFFVPAHSGDTDSILMPVIQDKTHTRHSVIKYVLNLIWSFSSQSVTKTKQMSFNVALTISYHGDIAR